jgi:hypothetical protein
MKFFQRNQKLWMVIVIVASLSLVLASFLPFLFR